MELKRVEKEKKNRILFSIISMIACFLIMGLICYCLVKHDLAAEKENYGYMAKNEAEHIVTTIDCVMARTNTLEAMIQDHGGDTSFFKNVSEDIYSAVTEETGVTLKNFAIAPNCIVSDVYPIKGNEELIGFDFLDTSREGNVEAKEAYEQGVTKLTNPFKLVQGGYGMCARSPVIIRDGEETKLWGLVTVTIDFNNLIEVLGFDNLEGMGANYKLAYIDSDGENHVMHSKGSTGEKAIKYQFSVRNLNWELTIEPKKGWISIWQVIIALIALLIISVFAGMFTNTMLKLRETNKILLQISVTDGLTGCLNRRAYEEALSELSNELLQSDFVYVSADLNGLKMINDTRGHMAGDEIIKGAKECIQEGLGSYGSVYRIGGDEFAALINIGDNNIEKLLEELDSITKKWKGDSVESLSLSVGYASHREYPEVKIDGLIKISDEKMYARKQEYYKNNGIERRRY